MKFAGSSVLFLFASVASLVSPLRGQCQRAKLLSSDMMGDDRFGLALAISGTTAIIGAENDHPPTEQSGAV